MRESNMHIYVIYAHPSTSSFTYEVLNSFLHGIKELGNTFEIGDLYEMNFECKLDIDQYTREISWKASIPVPNDVKKEQKKIQKADAIAFIFQYGGVTVLEY
jgi:NAD(P)H dehydrogenase (quinone)